MIRNKAIRIPGQEFYINYCQLLDGWAPSHSSHETDSNDYFSEFFIWNFIFLWLRKHIIEKTLLGFREKNSSERSSGSLD